MFNLQSEIGTAKDNFKSPVHNWYKFTAGFSYKFIDEIIEHEGLDASTKILDPFAGCGTTLVSAQKHGIPAVGFEGQRFMYEVIKAKLNWRLSEKKVKQQLEQILKKVSQRKKRYNLEKNAHDLLVSLYKEDTLKELYIIKETIASSALPKKYSQFFNLALSQTLHKVCIHPIAVPYIVRSKTLSNTLLASEVFEQVVRKMLSDLAGLKNRAGSSSIYLHDSRKKNRNVPDSSCDVCITSPPYLNNLDYGEVSKVHTHFFGITESWNDITQKVRKKLVTASTTHYSEAGFDLGSWKKREFYRKNKQVAEELISFSKKILEVRSDKKKGKSKSFDIMAFYYFEDMYFVLKEIKRILKEGKRAYLILGDSAPYGVFMNTTDLLGQIARSVGFSDYEIVEIRKRGSKWKNLTYRHNKELTENVLILK